MLCPFRTGENQWVVLYKTVLSHKGNHFNSKCILTTLVLEFERMNIIYSALDL